MTPGIAMTDAPDPELEQLPDPRRRGRLLTLAVMALTLTASLGLLVVLTPDLTYSLQSGQPVRVPPLADVSPEKDTAALANRYVASEAILGTTGAVTFSRPFQSGKYRLAPVAGNRSLWVEVRIPEGTSTADFVPPTAFVGRLVPFHAGGRRFTGLPQAASQPGAAIPEGAWVLVDGEAPGDVRWMLGLAGMLVVFAAFNAYGLFQLMRPIKDPA